MASSSTYAQRLPSYVAEGPREIGKALVVVEPSWTDVHVAYRSGARHRLDQGAAGRAILAGRGGERGVVGTDGELQAGARSERVEASVGVVSLESLDVRIVGPRLEQAARALRAVLR